MTYNQELMKRVANYLAAFAHVLGGRPGEFNEFRSRAELVHGGKPANLFGLMQLAERVKKSGRPLLWIYQSEDAPEVPQIGLVAEIAGQFRFFENAVLWLGENDDRATLVPDSFKMGGYRFDDKYRLRHVRRMPARNLEAAKDGMVRACNRLAMIQQEQWDRGDVFELPQFARAA